jgi:hypothetical protein
MTGDHGMQATRRDALLASLFALPLAFAAAAEGDAGPVDPAQTIITLPDKLVWHAGQSTGPPQSVESVALFGSTDAPGLYYQLIRWFPGYMSAPHMYDTDRLCVVVSGVWWVNSGADFDPANTVPCPAGTFIRRVAHTPHYDGVKADGKEPAVIAICGIGPNNPKWLIPGTPNVRRV